MASELRLDDVAPLTDFREAAERVLEFLHEHLGFGVWLVSRTSGEDQIVLNIGANEMGIVAGTAMPWTDTLCWRMVRGLGPRIAPDLTQVPAYSAAPIAQQLPLRAYVGVPLTLPDGQLFGTLCGVDARPQSPATTGHLPLVELQARLLSTVLCAELRALAEQRRADTAEAQAHVDSLTGLTNRRGWDRLLGAEEARCLRYGNPAGVLVLDLDGLKAVNDARGHGAGDELIARCAQVLRATVRRADLVARLGGDEFGVLAIETPPEQLRVVTDRVREALAAGDVRASIGVAARRSPNGLHHAWHDADALMYEVKRRRAGDGRSTGAGSAA